MQLASPRADSIGEYVVIIAVNVGRARYAMSHNFLQNNQFRSEVDPDLLFSLNSPMS